MISGFKASMVYTLSSRASRSGLSTEEACVREKRREKRREEEKREEKEREGRREKSLTLSQQLGPAYRSLVRGVAM